MEQKENEEEHSSINLGFEIAVESYNKALQRFDVINNSIDKTLTWVTTVNLGFVALSAKNEIPFCSFWFIISMIFLSGLITCAVVTKLKKIKAMISPQKIYDKWITKSEIDFKKDFIRYAGQDYEINKTILSKNANLSDLMISLFILEVVTLVLWIISH